jgi:hypothetical protein
MAVEMTCAWLAQSVFRPPCPTGGGGGAQILGVTIPEDDSTTSDSAFVPIAGLEVTIVASAEGAVAAIFVSGSTTNTTSDKRAQFEVTVDDVSTGDRAAVYVAVAGEKVAVALATQTTLSPGSHSIKATWRTDVAAEAQITINEMRLEVIVGSAP